MNRTFAIRPGLLTTIIGVWIIAEVAAFVLVAQWLGFGGALLAMIAAMILGFAILRRIGFNAVRNLRRAVEGDQPSAVAMLDGSLAALGALLLIVPGFVTDVFGLALAAPSVRQWLAHRFGGAPRAPGPPPRVKPRTIDLPADDWQRIEDGKA